MKNLYFDTRILLDHSVAEVEEVFKEFLEKEAKRIGSIRQDSGY